MLCSARLAFGDEVVAERLFDRDYDPGFVSRHTNQCAGLWTSYVEAQ